MRVLMLGWEFPPYMSGGLGTACYGMTKALAEKEVEVTFVLPRMSEQGTVPLHDKVKLKEASGTKISWSDSYETPSYFKSISPQFYGKSVVKEYVEQKKSATVKEVWEKYLNIKPVNSMLHAYATTQSFETLHAEEGYASSYMYDPCTSPETFMQYTDGVLCEETKGKILEIIQGSQSHSVHGETVLSLQGGYGHGLMQEVFRYSQSMLAFQEESFDLIHAHEWMTCPAAIVLKQLSGKPLVLHIHALESDRSGINLNSEVATIERAGVEAADVIVAVSHYTKSRIVDLYGINPDKIVVVHNAVSQEESRTHLDIPVHEKTKYVLFMGRITFQKGPEYFIEAAKLVLSRMPNVRFIMAGSGDMLRRMIDMVARMRMGNRFHFTGFLRGEDVDRMYAMSDLYVMPSVSEPFGIAPLEAMSYDTPVLISRQSGVAEVVQNALKVDFWDVRSMANKICAVLSYPKLANEMVTQCKEELQYIRWDNAANKLITVYENCLN